MVVSEIKWIKSKIEGRAGVVVPYNQKFNDELKALVPSARFREDRQTDAWFFDEEAKPDVLPILERFYVNQKWQRIEWSLNRDDVTVDGAQLFYVNRDYWKWANRFPYKFKIVEEELSSGGSRANPGMYGRVVVDILCREGAEFRPEPVSVEDAPGDEADAPGDEADAPNPLTIFPDDMLVAELQRRGHDLSVDGVEAVQILHALMAAYDRKSSDQFQQVIKFLLSPRFHVEDAPGDEADAPNPLTIFPDDMLVAELQRRGHDLSVDGVEAVQILHALMAAYDRKSSDQFQQGIKDTTRLLKRETAS
jgi:hypothetical protein